MEYQLLRVVTSCSRCDLLTRLHSTLPLFVQTFVTSECSLLVLVFMLTCHMVKYELQAALT